MYIQPNSTVIFCRGVPFDNSYKHTVLFGTETAQHDYFYSKRAGKLPIYSKVSYVQPGEIMVEGAADDFFSINYMMYQNTAFGSKWFYAFVNRSEYVANKTTRIFFEIDVMQTYHFDYKIMPSFVEREHSDTDKIGENTIDERLDFGEEIKQVDSDPVFVDLTSQKVVLMTSEPIRGSDEQPIPEPPHIFGGVYTGLYAYVTNLSGANEIIKELSDPTALAIVYQYPSIANAEGALLPDPEFPQLHRFEVERPASIDGYIPRNNKLYCFPYVRTTVLSSDGQNEDFRFEWFADDEGCARFLVAAVGIPEAQAVIMPMSYRGAPAGGDVSSMIVLKNFPQCAWVSDVYKAYLAHHASATGISVVSDVINIVSGTMTGNAAAAVGGVAGIANTVAQLRDIKSLPNTVQGHASGTNIMQALGQVGFKIYRRTIKAEFAKIIDDYFTMFGYATRRVKIPNRAARRRWSFVKTQDCHVDNADYRGLPADDMRKIESIYDQGVTFWMNANDVGDYSRDNGPVNGGAR